jgi:galactoside O-acetyltransferase
VAEAHGFAAIGSDVTIHPTALFFGAEHIRIGSHVRIDAHVIVTAGPGEVVLGDHVHLAAAAHLFGTAGIVLADFAGVSSRASLFSTTDDYTSGHLTGPTVPLDTRQVQAEPIHVDAHGVIGCGAVLLPGVRLGRGSAVGALSLVRRDVEPFSVVAGTPARPIATRDRERLEALERRLLDAG